MYRFKFSINDNPQIIQAIPLRWCIRIAVVTCICLTNRLYIAPKRLLSGNIYTIYSLYLQLS